ncbi:MAG: hypothetical protein SPK94_07885 [Bacteroidales bacterium]|nr:hypothetical protein [Bacteroidales bacterium]
MKVLKFKKVNEFKVKQRCENCRAVLELEEQDIEITPIGYRSCLVGYRFICPICQERQELNFRNFHKFSLYRHTKDVQKGEKE